MIQNLYPQLIIAAPDDAISFYQRILDARLIERFVDGSERVVHAAVDIGGSTLSIAQGVPDWGLHDPISLGGSPCLLHLDVDDPDTLAEAMVADGATILIAIADRPYGKREGRVRDPFGHLWILSKTIEDLSGEEISTRLRR